MRKKQRASTRRVETTINIRTTTDLKKRFLEALSVGRKTSVTDAIEAFMEAYVKETKRANKQPEYPFEIREKTEPEKTSK